MTNVFVEEPLASPVSAKNPFNTMNKIPWSPEEFSALLPLNVLDGAPDFNL